MSSTIQIRVDDDLRAKSDSLFKKLGTDTTNAIRMFLVQAVEMNGFPFEIKIGSRNPYAPMDEEALISKLEASRNHADQGLVREADDMIRNMRNRATKNTQKKRQP